MGASKEIVNTILLIVLLAMLAGQVVATSEYYVDPDFSGTSTGTTASPWKSLGSTEWKTIDSSLASSDVTVYYSARAAGGASNQATTTGMQILRSDTSNHRVTLDGMSKYNTNDASPSWVANTGNYKFQITAGYPLQENSINRSYVTIRGFKIIATSGQAYYYFGGNHLLIESNEFMQVSSATIGPTVTHEYAYIPGNPGRSNGGNIDIAFRNNIIHDSVGECIYIGGADNSGVSAHRDILIENNTIYNCGALGEEGDGIDIKDGMTNVTIRGNTIFNTTGGNHMGISAHSAVTVDRNVVANAAYGVYLTGFWGTGLNGSRITNNLFYNDVAGVVIDNGNEGGYSVPANDVQILNNTMASLSQAGIMLNSYSNLITNAVIKNNIITSSAGSGIGGSGTAPNLIVTYNDIYSNNPNYAGPASGKSAGNLAVDPLFTSAASPAGADGIYFTSDDGYKPQASSQVCGAGESGSDIGAYACSATSFNMTGDINQDGKVDLLDLQMVVADFGKTSSFDSRVDLKTDGKIDLFDVMVVVQNWGRTS